MKRLLVMLLLAVFAMSVSVLAAEMSSFEGYIESKQNGSIVVVSQDGENRIVLHITPETYVVDVETGFPLDLEDRTGDHVIAYFGPALALSEPPQGSAILILGNIPEGTIPPQFGRVEAVEVSEDEVVVTVRNGSLLVTIERDIRIDPFFTRNIVTIDDIQVGSDLLMFFPMVTASYPALAFSQRTIILNRGEVGGDIEFNGYTDDENDEENDEQANDYAEDYNDNEQANDYAEDDDEQDNDYDEDYNDNEQEELYVVVQPAVMPLTEALNMAYYQFYTENDITMAPLRLIAEAMGFTVTWNEEQRSVALQHSDGEVFSTVVLEHNYFEGRTLEAAPTIRNDRTFVPVSFFEILLGL